ncbi:10991_t:CDS:2 [Cetraspora pellucida]|uniref:10991_t:CDS:1 n=1 Tax=Cetraspora pellucida TaxID=1433469 RepID=A0A9N9NC40_9GLOM|nr:10991_t:CDS:2 [Cetraspora pellucida]
MQNNDLTENNTFKVVLDDNENWKWVCFDEYCNRSGKPERQVRIESINANPFVVVYPRDGNPYVELSSHKLINILKDILPSKKLLFDDNYNYNSCDESSGWDDEYACSVWDDEDDCPKGNVSKPEANEGPICKINARDLFHVMKELKNATKSVTDLECSIHLKRLIRFLEQEYKKTIKIRKKMIANKTVSYEMLWVFYTENLDIWYRCAISKQQVGGVIVSVEDSGVNFKINIKIIEYDGIGFKHCQIVREINRFDGEVSFSDLPVVPIELSITQDFLKENIMTNGKQFFNLASGHHFMKYEGPLLRDRCMWIEKIRADGRVMVDLQSFATMNPDYQMGNAKPPNKCDVKILKEKNTYIEQNKLHQDSNYFLAPAVVYGFSFTVKEWGLFEISKFSDITFDTDALSQVVMPENKKRMLEGLVSQYADTVQKTISDSPFEKSLDPISNKGNGCIFLCYGPPGTGKTLTAQSVAEFLRLPLWVITVRELGSSPEKLEKELVKILDIAHIWKAVILLDEADIYLEKRSTVDLTRNTLVGIFLRVIFLTTNRVITFDDAVCSRVSMFFHYPKLGPSERLQVWTNFIKRASLPLKADDFINYELNGREIRNVLHTARLLAKNEGKDLASDIVIDVIKVIQDFRQVTDEMDVDI